MRIGILGLGSAGGRHLQAFRRIPGVSVVAADLAHERREHARAAGVPVVPTLSDPLALRPEAVVVAVPHADLAAAAVQALEAGCHVLIEKPMATRLEDAARVVRLARALGRRLMVSFVHRFRPEVVAARVAIARGEIGRPTVLIDTMVSGRSAMPPWVWDRARSGGGMMVYNGIHQIDRARFLLGDEVHAVRAEALALAHGGGAEDTAAALLRFRSGALDVVVQHKAPADALSRWETQVVGTDGSLRVQTGHEVRWIAGGAVSSLPSAPEDRFLRTATEFVAALREGRDPSPSGEDGLAALKVIADKITARAAGMMCWIGHGDAPGRPQEACYAIQLFGK